MKDQPLQSNEQSKIIIFSVLLLPSMVFLFGIIPVLFLVFGIYMMKKNSDFIHIETAVKNFRVYCYIAILIGIILAVYVGVLYLDHMGSESARVAKLEDGSTAVWVADMDRLILDKYEDMMMAVSAILVIPVIYLILLRNLFYTPLSNHKDWVEKKGIFLTDKTKETKDNEKSVDIIKGEKLKSYLVSDELLKWAKLKEDGHISEQEYNKARKKLLGDI